MGACRSGIAPSAINRHDADGGRHQSATIMTFGDVCRTFAAFHVAPRYIAAAIGLTAGIAGAAYAAKPDIDNADIAYRRSIERRTFTDAEILDGFFKVTFGAEFHVAGGVDRIRKYDGPVKVFIDNRA